jgi:hypothetical protein
MPGPRGKRRVPKSFNSKAMSKTKFGKYKAKRSKIPNSTATVKDFFTAARRAAKGRSDNQHL